MANNVLTGKLFDENLTFIGDNSVRYFGIHKSGVTVRVSETRVSENGYYNFNLGDPDWLGQDVQALANDDIAIVVWQDQSKSVSSTELTRFAVHFFKHTGLDLYVKDLQLKPSQAPSCVFSIDDYYTIGQVITVNNQASDTYQWDYDGNTHYHRSSVLGVPLFSIGLNSTYTFNGVQQSTNTYTFNSQGVYSVEVTNTNLFGLTSTCSKTTNIAFRPPVTEISYSPSTIQLGTPLSLSFNTTDIDSTVQSIEYFVNGESIGTSESLLYTDSYIISEVKPIEIKAVSTWFDGFSTKTSTFTKNIAVENQPPVTELTYSKKDNVVTVEHNSYDPDGEVVSYKWEIYYVLPFSNEVRLVYTETETEHNSKEFTLPTPGTYKFKLTVSDNLGSTAFDEFDESIEIITCEIPPNTVMCNTIRDVIPYEFSMNVFEYEFGFNVIEADAGDNPFKVNTYTHEFSLNEYSYEFSVERNEYTFDFNTQLFTFERTC